MTVHPHPKERDGKPSYNLPADLESTLVTIPHIPYLQLTQMEWINEKVQRIP